MKLGGGERMGFRPVFFGGGAGGKYLFFVCVFLPEVQVMLCLSVACKVTVEG